MTKKNKSNWTIISDHTYESFPIFTVKKSRRKNPLTGTQIDFVRVDGLDWVSVLAITKDEKVVLVHQYRHGYEDYILELPGGCIESNEEPIVSGSRELLEETGYSAKKLEPLGTILPNPAMYSMRNFIFLARDVELAAEQMLDSGEDITVQTIDFDEYFNMVKDGTLNHTTAVAAAGLYLLKYK